MVYHVIILIHEIIDHVLLPQIFRWISSMINSYYVLIVIILSISPPIPEHNYIIEIISSQVFARIEERKSTSIKEQYVNQHPQIHNSYQFHPNGSYKEIHTPSVRSQDNRINGKQTRLEDLLL